MITKFNLQDENEMSDEATPEEEENLEEEASDLEKEEEGSL